MDVTETSYRIRSTLAGLVTHLQQLHDLLVEEKQALTSGKMESLPELAQRKDTVSSNIEQSELQRRNLLNSLHIDHSTQGMKQFARLLPHTEMREIALAWHNIEDLGKICQQLNKINGIMLAHHYRHTRTALQILRGQLNNAADIYSARGNTHNQLGQNTLGRI